MDQPSSSRSRVLSRLARWAALAMVPLALLVHLAAPDRHLLLFIVSALGIIPLAGAMGHATEALAQRFGSGIGGILNATFGNAAEHSTAVLVARKGKMKLAITIAVESSRQIALFVAPVLVLLGLTFRQPMTLEFSLLEVGAVGVAVLIVNSIAQDGESNWLEGAMLLAR